MPAKGRNKYTNQDMLDAIGEAALLGTGPLSGKAYDEYRAAFGGPSHMGIIARFGTWRSACAAAGVAANATRSYTSRWSETDLIEWVAAYLTDGGGKGTYLGYSAWAKTQPGAPSGVRLTPDVPVLGRNQAPSRPHRRSPSRPRCLTDPPPHRPEKGGQP